MFFKGKAFYDKLCLSADLIAEMKEIKPTQQRLGHQISIHLIYFK